MLSSDTTITYAMQTRYVVMYLATRYETTKKVVCIPEEKVESSTVLCGEEL
jgi:hypothetical protein